MLSKSGSDESPSHRIFLCFSESSRKGFPKGIPRRRQCLTICSKNQDELGLVQGSIAPCSSDLFSSGITKARSIVITRPKPWHSGQAPSGLLNENMLGVGCLYSRSHSAQWNPSESLMVFPRVKTAAWPLP